MVEYWKLLERIISLYGLVPLLFRLGAYSRNLRNTIRNKQKYFFYDIGIRNAIINNFTPVSERNDICGLWENFCIVERIKRNAYVGGGVPNYYFYQSYQGQEIDLIEEMNGYHAFECKWKKSRVSSNTQWKLEYPNVLINIINGDNFLEYFSV